MPNGSPAYSIAARVVDLAMTEASQLLLRVAVVVVDRGGHVVASGRMDNVGFVNTEVARRKATASVTFGVPTHAMAEMLERDEQLRSAMSATGDFVVTLPGGFPLTEIATTVGGFGIAGGHYEQDQLIGERVMKTLATEMIGGGR
jgi:glc operon protein GlcG